ncbi:MAG: hypothetical protein IKU10_03520 [Clostridia bacterium]|nr:hypothetical protein [Clostridia bacterium]
MKRVVSFVLAFFIFSCLNISFLPCVLAAKTATLTVTSPSSCASGDTITVYVGVKKNANIASGEFRVSFNTEAFDYVSYGNEELSKGMLSVGNCKNGEVIFAMAGTDAIVDEGNLFSIKFKAKSQANGTCRFKFSSPTCSDYDGNDIDTNVAVASITVKPKQISNNSQPSLVPSKTSTPSKAPSKKPVSSMRSASSKVVSSKRSPLSVPVSSTPSVSSTVTSVPEVPHVIETESLIPMESVVSLPVYEQEVSATPASSEADSGTRFESIGWLLVLIVAAVLLVPLAVFVIIFSCIKLKSSNNK